MSWTIHNQGGNGAVASMPPEVPEVLNVPSRVTFRVTYLALLLVLLLAGSVFYALTAGIEPGTVLAFAAEAAGFAFILLALSARRSTLLRILIAAFVLIWVASWIVTLIVFGTLEPLEILGFAIALAAVYMMLQIVSAHRGAPRPGQAAAPAFSAGSLHDETPRVTAQEGRPQAAEERREIFISYSREDQKFAERLTAALEAGDRGAWIDREDIRGGAEWWPKIQQGIESALAVILVLSPDFVESRVCSDEVKHAVSLNKRLVPVMYREVAPAATHERVRALNWICYADDFDTAFAEIVETAETDQEWLDRHARLSERAGEWMRSGRDKSLLLRGSDLKGAERCLAEQGEHNEAASKLQQEFVLESRRRETARMWTIVAAAMVVVVVSVALGGYAWYERNNAIERAQIARSRALAVSSAAQLRVDPELSLILALEAYDTAPTKQALAALRRGIAATHVRAAVHPSGIVETVQLRGRELLTFGDLVQAWDAETGRELPRPGIAPPNRQATVFDEYDCEHQLATGMLPSPVGDVKAVACSGGRVLVQDASTGETRFSIGDGGFPLDAPVSMEFDRAGGRLAVAVGDPICGDGDAAGSTLGEVWYVAGERRISWLRGHSAPIRSLALSPDGRWAITGSCDSTARVWEVDTERMMLVLRGHTAQVTAVTISPDAALAATASLDGTARVWSTSPVRIVEQAPIDSPRAAAWTESTAPYAVRRDNRQGEVIERETGRHVSTLEWGDDPPNHVEFSPDGRRLVTVGGDVRTRTGSSPPAVWDTASGARITTLDEVAPIYAAAFTPDGNRLVTGGQSSVIRLWNLSEPEVPVVVDHARSVITDVATSPDGRRFAVASEHPDVRVYDVDRPWAEPVLLTGHEAHVAAVEFSPDSALLLTTGTDDTARVWEAATGELLLSFPNQHATDGTPARFARDGTSIVITDAHAEDAQLIECDVCGTVAQLEQRARSRVTRELTAQERATFLPDE